MTTIVCATHFTDSSEDAVHVAAALAERTGQRLVLASVLPTVQFMEVAPASAEAGARHKLEVAAVQLRQRGLTVATEVVHGNLDASLSRLCHLTGAKLLVVGDGRQAKRPLFGTPVDRMVAGVDVPLLVVRSSRPFDAWGQGHGPLRVLLAIDHSWSSALARDWLTNLAAYGALQVVATHVWSPQAEFTRRGLQTSPSDEDQQDLARQLRAETERALRGLPSNVTYRVHLEIGDGHIAELLIDVAARERVDLIVLGTHPHQKGLLGILSSVSHEVLADAMMSVAFVPADQAAPKGQEADLLGQVAPRQTRSASPS